MNGSDVFFIGILILILSIILAAISGVMFIWFSFPQLLIKITGTVFIVGLITSLLGQCFSTEVKK